MTLNAEDSDRAAATAATAAEQRGIQSIEVGGQLLRALVHIGRPMALKELAREADMAPAKAHPYMVSYGRLGLVEQDAASGFYGLGPLALQLGLIALHQADPLLVATPLLAPLAQRIDHTTAIAVWGNRGATIVRIAEAPSSIHVSVRHGTVLSLTHTASGRLFGAYLDAAMVRRLLQAQRRLDKTLLVDWKAFALRLADVRARGLSRSEGDVLPGINAMAAPVFDHTGTMVLALIAIGPAAAFDAGWHGDIARALREAAEGATARLGGQLPTLAPALMPGS